MVTKEDGTTLPVDHRTTTSLGLIALFLRFFAIPLAVSSLWVMSTDKQLPDGYGKVKYSNISGFKYLACVDAISAIYALVTIVLSRITNFARDWGFYIGDQATAYLMLTSGSAAAEVLFLAYRGSRAASWSEACSYYGKFCNRAKLSLLLHFLALLCFVALALISAFRVFSKLGPPSAVATRASTSKENGEPVE